MTTDLAIPDHRPQRRFRSVVPEAHRGSLDTRIQWLWNQRFGTIQNIWKESRDVLDHTATTLFLQAIVAKDLESIAQLLQRLEGGALIDEDVQERAEQNIRV